jgi:hypothetical protein
MDPISYMGKKRERVIEAEISEFYTFISLEICNINKLSVTHVLVVIP